MQKNMRRNFTGSAKACETSAGAWRLDCGGPREAQIVIRGADPRAAAAFAATLSDVGIEWQTPQVLLTMLSAGHVATVEAAAVMVHEPLPTLYTALPLAEFDARAQRFWRRVFFLVRIPGGRSLLGVLAHLSRRHP